MTTPDPVNHPAHYLTHRSGIECIQITEHLNFCLGNALKYIWRADEKGDAINDLAKAAWYIDREITRRKALADIENARLIGVIADCLEKDMLPKTASSTSAIPQTNLIEKTGNTLAYAQAGDARRQYQMGVMCYYGDGMPEDKEQAVEWWTLAAKQGNYEAQLALVTAYRKGEGVEKNGRLANYWLEQAGSQRTEEGAQ
jgi:TPR repeat protein